MTWSYYLDRKLANVMLVWTQPKVIRSFWSNNSSLIFVSKEQIWGRVYVFVLVLKFFYTYGWNFFCDLVVFLLKNWKSYENEAWLNFCLTHFFIKVVRKILFSWPVFALWFCIFCIPFHFLTKFTKVYCNLHILAYYNRVTECTTIKWDT